MCKVTITWWENKKVFSVTAHANLLFMRWNLMLYASFKRSVRIFLGCLYWHSSALVCQLQDTGLIARWSSTDWTTRSLIMPPCFCQDFSSVVAALYTYICFLMFQSTMVKNSHKQVKRWICSPNATHSEATLGGTHVTQHRLVFSAWWFTKKG